MWYSKGVEGEALITLLLMNKISQIVNDFIQRIIYNNQNVAGILFTEEYQYVVDECGIIRFMD